eukprot:1886259-Lingulodinium_polyedra.AAC.1
MPGLPRLPGRMNVSVRHLLQPAAVDSWPCLPGAVIGERLAGRPRLTPFRVRVFAMPMSCFAAQP